MVQRQYNKSPRENTNKVLMNPVHTNDYIAKFSDVTHCHDHHLTSHLVSYKEFRSLTIPFDLHQDLSGTGNHDTGFKVEKTSPWMWL